ncbi:hypothetical protein LAUMK13_05518 [Mycobacterium innocens]|uniref:Uncharacterized protein n=1 Tax=Mycobacterium innocens TaxID=2341083 RepID=A0A498QJK5_9MYCO|nr:hypothetical protein LAUMK13_05518 [Mycobacterium innocens]
MTSRAEITARFAKSYVKASKKAKCQILDQVVKVRFVKWFGPTDLHEFWPRAFGVGA